MSELATWLQNLGLSKYYSAFKANEIEFFDLRDLTLDDLKELGLPVGPRRRVLTAVEKLKTARSSQIPTLSDAAYQNVSGEREEKTEVDRRQLTVMFVDLVSSTELSGQLDPEDLRALMGRYQASVAAAVSKRGGYLANWLGDGAIVYFGWPTANEGQAIEAAHAGLEVIESVGDIPVGENSGEMMKVRVGIATGQVVIGDLELGSTGQHGMVSGETPNLAARLEALAAPNEVVIERTTQLLVASAFDLDFLGPHELKGFGERIETWRIKKPRAAESRFDTQNTQLTPFVGRTHEVGLLLDRWQQVQEGEGQVVVISGEPGIGKSRTIRTLRERIESDKHRTIYYQCSQYHMNSALYPAKQQLEHAAGLAVEGSADDKLDRLEAVLRQATSEVGQVAPLIAALLGIPFKARYGTFEMPTQQQRVATLRALVDQLVGLTRESPVLFVLEDAHWIDPTTQELIIEIAPQIVDLGVMMLISHRPEWKDPFQAQGHVTRLNMTRLSRKQIAEMVRDVAGRALPGKTTARIAQRTDGVPLFVEELTKAMMEATSGTNHADVPVTLQASLMARLDRLKETKEIAQIGAVIGREFHHDLLVRVVGKPDDLGVALKRLIDAQLLYRVRREGGAVYSFKHALIQDVAYDSLLRQRRRSLHLSIANALLETESIDPAPEVLARHFELGGDLEQSFSWYDRAGRRAAERSAQPEAVAHCTNALRILRTLTPYDGRDQQELELLLRLGQAQLGALGGGVPETVATFERAATVAARVNDVGAAVQAHYAQYVGQMISGALVKACQIGEHTLQIASDSNTEWVKLVAARMICGARYLMGDITGAQEMVALFREVSKTTSDEIPTGFAHDPTLTMLPVIAHAEWASGNRDTAFDLMKSAIEEIVRTDPDANSLSFALSWSILLGGFDRNPELLEEASSQLADHAYRTGGKFWASIARWGAGVALMLRGDVPKALPLLEKGTSGFSGTSARQHFPFMQLYLAEAHHLNGDTETALRILADAHDLIDRTEQRFFEPEMHRLRGIMLQSMGRENDANEAYRKAVELAKSQGSVIWGQRASESMAGNCP